MLRRRLLIPLTMMLLLVLAVAGYKGLAVYREMQQLGAPRLPVSVSVATVQQRPGLQTLVPQSAVAYTLSGHSVYVVINRTENDEPPVHIVERRHIEIGEQRDGQVVVTRGLMAGERVIITGWLDLSNGAVVNITHGNALQLDASNSH
jgi:hypothetical protein